MARMHPEDIEGLENVTEGERKVFRFLWQAARPDSDFSAGQLPYSPRRRRGHREELFFNRREMPSLENTPASGGATS
jgi:hypothetical protein